MCNGTADDTAGFKAAIAAAAGRPVYVPVGVCRVSSVTVTAGITLQGEGPSSILKQLVMPSGEDNPVLEAGNNTLIRNIKIDGNRANQPTHSFSDAYNNAGGTFASTCFSCGSGRGYLAGIRGEGVSGLTVTNVEITATFGAAVATINSSNVTLTASNIHDTNFEALYASGTTYGGTGFRTVSGSNYTVTNNTLRDIGVGGGPAPRSAPKRTTIVLSRVNTAEHLEQHARQRRPVPDQS